jgi:hypothetical protein
MAAQEPTRSFGPPPRGSWLASPAVPDLQESGSGVLPYALRSRGATPATARLSPGVREMLARQAIWDELERPGATGAEVSFSGKAGRGGSITTITLDRVDGQQPLAVEWWDRDELAYALESPVWDRLGGFAGHPAVRGTVRWTVPDRLVVTTGRRGDQGFEEVVR